MSHTYTSIWLHFVFGTKKRDFLIEDNWKRKLFLHIQSNAKQKGIHVDFINGVEDHIHLLVAPKTTQSPALIARLLKGESSRWINKQQLCLQPFKWQIGYSVFSVSRQNLDRVRNYIRKQEEHHADGLTFSEELNQLISYL
ncbi:MAG: IS200/IS605 family transposase [Saprospiraceae bacterium]|nr:IS200/IS605 family transposase [Saprospiraceae bacterium]